MTYLADSSDAQPQLDRLRAGDPERLGPYRIRGRLGVGGMAIAYLGERDGRLVVVKAMGNHVSLDRRAIDRLERELASISAVQSPRTVALIDRDLDFDPPWFAMEYVPGGTLETRVDQGSLVPDARIRQFALDLALAIKDVHDAHVIHRDIKPSNIIMAEPYPRLIDFGIAASLNATVRTATSGVMGTLGWLAPEQFERNAVDPAVDIHAWALCVHFAASGRNPYSAPTPAESMNKLLHEDPARLDVGDPALEALVGKALSKSPQGRPALEDIISQLKKPSTGSTRPRPTRPPVRRRSWMVPAAVIAVIVGSALGFLTATSLLRG